MPMYNVEGMGKVRGHLGNLRDDVKVEGGNGKTKAERAIKAILETGRSVIRNEYMIANSKGVENTDEVYIRVLFDHNWAMINTSGKRLFFAEFGTGVNQNGGTSRGRELGYTPASWSLGEGGKGYLTGTRFVIFQGWWPVKKSVTHAERRTFTFQGKEITRRVKQGYPPVNAMEAASKEMRSVATAKLKHFFEH